LKPGLRFNHGNLTFILSVEPIGTIHPHEEVIPGILSSIEASLRRSGAQLDPVIVDSSSGVALDGMHRVEALRRMGASKILACKVDYRSRSVRLRRWLRAYEGTSNPLLEDLKVRLDLTRVSHAEAVQEVVSHRSPAALFAGGVSFRSRMPFESVRGSLELVRVFDTVAARSGIRPRIVTDAEAESLIESGAFVFYPPAPAKKDVVESGISRMLMPPKSTRHLIPARPVGLTYPLGWLLDAKMSLKEANTRLEHLVAESKVFATRPGSEYNGRVYEEALYRFVRGVAPS
jgi:hypothetical protein